MIGQVSELNLDSAPVPGTARNRSVPRTFAATVVVVAAPAAVVVGALATVVVTAFTVVATAATVVATPAAVVVVVGDALTLSE